MCIHGFNILAAPWDNVQQIHPYLPVTSPSTTPPSILTLELFIGKEHWNIIMWSLGDAFQHSRENGNILWWTGTERETRQKEMSENLVFGSHRETHIDTHTCVYGSPGKSPRFIRALLVYTGADLEGVYAHSSQVLKRSGYVIVSTWEWMAVVRFSAWLHLACLSWPSSASLMMRCPCWFTPREGLSTQIYGSPHVR